MNKKFAELFGSMGLTVSDKKAYGVFKGYETSVSIHMLDASWPFTMQICFFADDDKKQQIDVALKNSAFKFFTHNFNAYGLYIAMNDMTVGALCKRLPAVLERIYGILTDFQAYGAGFCPICGERFEECGASDRGGKVKCEIDGFTVTMDEKCKADINTYITQENNAFANAPNNYLRGFLGALIGGAAGIGASFLLYLAGFVSAISSFVAVALGALLYVKFGGKPNKMMIVIVSTTALVCMVISIFAVYIVAAGIIAADAGVKMSAFEAFSFYMKDDKFSSSFVLDLVLTLVFAVIGVVSQIFVLKKQIKKPQNIQ